MVNRNFYQQQRMSLPLVLIIFYAGISCLTPFLGPQMRDKGFTRNEASKISMSCSFVSVIGPIIIGILAARRRKYKLFLIVTIAMSSVFYTVLHFIPRVQRIPRDPLKQFDCTSSIYLEKCDNWENCIDAQLNAEDLTTFRLSNCRYICENARVADVSYPLHICFDRENGNNLCSVYNPLLAGNVSLSFQTHFSEWITGKVEDMKTTDFLEYDEDMPPQTVEVCQFHPRPPIIIDDKSYNNIYCRPVPHECSMRCQLTFLRNNKEILPTPCIDTLGDIHQTFYAYLGMRSLADLCLVTSIFLLDALVLINSNDFYGMYGRTHLWSAVGLASISPLSGVLIDYFSAGYTTANYLPAICIYDLMIVIACCLLAFLPIESPRRTDSIETIGYHRQNSKPYVLEVVSLVTVVLVLGTEWGIMDTYLHWYYVDIGCSKLIIGLTQSVAFCCSLPLLRISKNMVQDIGKGNLIVYAFLFYGIRYAGISFVPSPWFVLLFEAMESFTLSVMWIGLVAYGQSIISNSSRLIMQYSLNILHFCIGRGLGSFLGEIFITKFGHVPSFRGIAVFSTLFGFLFLLHYNTLLKRHYKPKRNLFSGIIKKKVWFSSNNLQNGDQKIYKPILNSEEQGST